MRSTSLAVAALVATAAVTGCGAGGHRQRHNLLLITLDTTRADRLGCYGRKDAHTPNLDRLAAAGSVFDHAYATAPITAPSHASILSGTYPPFHQVRDNDAYGVPPSLPWLPTILKQHGYTTAAMVAAVPLRSAIGFSRGFDYYGDQLEAPPGSLVITNLHMVGVASRRGERISEEFKLWLASRHDDDGPFFVWLHYYDPHYPWDPAGGYADLFATSPYEGEIAYMDECVGTALRALAENGLEATTGIVVVGDHGESLMEHGELTHALLTYGSTLRVPLIAHLPWLEKQPPRIDTFVSTTDVMPTALAALDIDLEPLNLPVQGRSLLPILLNGEPAAEDPAWDRQLYFESFYPFHHYRWSPLSGFIARRLKYIHGSEDELYDLKDDPAESRSLGSPEALAEMSSGLVALKAKLAEGRPASSRSEVDRQTLDSLRALGYVGSVSGRDAEALEDLSALPHPRIAMEAFFKYNEVLAKMRDGHLLQALELASSIAESYPEHKDARLLVASLHMQLGDLEAADRDFVSLIEDFDDKDVGFRAGLHFLSRGDLKRARGCFERLVAEDPGDVESLASLADVAVAEGAPAEARQLLEKALTVDPFYRDALLALAVLLDRQGAEESGRYFEKVAGRYPFDPHVNYDFAVYLLKHGREDEGLARLSQAAALASPPLWEAAQFALAGLFEQRGQLDRAVDALREITVSTNSPEALRQAQARLEALEAD